MRDLSILIPARNEMFLKRTIEDILENIESDTEVIAVLDGEWADPQIPQHERVNIIYLDEPVGQRVATNLACKLSKAKYVMKVDAHCAFDKGFDRKMIEFFEKVGGDTVAVPVMRNLHAFDWKCYKCGWKKYQGPTPLKCEQCGSTRHMRKKMLWQPKRGTRNSSYCFDNEPHFQYFSDYKNRETYKIDKETKGYTETMSLQGSCFMCTRELYWRLDLCSEDFPSWGSQGIEVACKTWLSGGQVLVNHNTWYAHMFRTQGGDFGFPYKQHQSKVEIAKHKAKEMFLKNQWPGQKRRLGWLLKRFWPVPGWPEGYQKYE